MPSIALKSAPYPPANLRPPVTPEQPSSSNEVVLVTGGRSTTSSEILGAENENCLVPKLPELRVGHTTFVLNSGQVATCGGWWEGKPTSSDCLLLNTTSKQWERGMLGGLKGNTVVGTITNQFGVFAFHRTTSSFLAKDSIEWIDGPKPPTTIECSTGIPDGTILTIGGAGGREVRQYRPSAASPTADSGWLPAETWQDLQIGRHRPGCVVFQNMAIIAGGWQFSTSPLAPLASIEVIYLEVKARGMGLPMLMPRAGFWLVVLGLKDPQLVALGGDSNTTEWTRDPVGGEWYFGPQLEEERGGAAAVVVDKKICSRSPPPPTTCPTQGGGSCVFPFIDGKDLNFSSCHMPYMRLCFSPFYNHYKSVSLFLCHYIVEV